jgi:hypothetical protein
MLIYVEWEAGSQKSEDGRCKERSKTTDYGPSNVLYKYYFWHKYCF